MTTLQQPRRRAQQQQRGMGILELMIGVALGLLVVVGVGSAFVSTRQASRSSDSLSGMQETLRSASELMTRDLREAGGNPCDGSLLVANVVNSVANAAPAAWYANWAQALAGYDGISVSPAVAIGSGVGQRVSGTDAVTALFVQDVNDLTVTAHDVATAVFTVNNNPHRVQAGDLLMVCDYRQAAVLSASAVTTTTVSHTAAAGGDNNCSRGLGLPTLCTGIGNAFQFNPGAKMGRLQSVAWYVGNNGRAAGGGRSLYRMTRAGTEEVADGVQNLQLQYLRAGATGYADADSLAAADWPNVLGIRVTLTLASTDATVSSANARLQRPLTFTLTLRNRLP